MAGFWNPAALPPNDPRRAVAATPAWPTGGAYAGSGVSVRQAAATGGSAPGSDLWMPDFLRQPYIPYPSSPYAGGVPAHRRGGGGGGGMVMPSASAYNPTMYYGPGAYMPGHQAQFQQQMQGNLLHIAAGSPFQETMGQPALLAAAQQRALRSPQGRLAAGLPLYGGGSSGGSGGLAGGFQSAYDEARQANEARGQDIGRGFQDRYARNMAYLQGAGAQEARDINQAYDRDLASRKQDLQSRGLGHSTFIDSAARGNLRDRRDSLGRLEERLRQQYIAADTQLSGDVLSFLERINDTYPDYNQLAQLAQLEGTAGVGQPGGAGNNILGYNVSLMPAGGGMGYAPVFFGGGGRSDARQAQNRMNVANRVADRNALMAEYGINAHQANLMLAGKFAYPSSGSSYYGT